MYHNELSKAELINILKEKDAVIERLNKEAEEIEKLNFFWTGYMGKWSWDYPTGKVLANDLKYKALGYEPGEVEFKVYDFCNLLHKDDYDRVMENMRQHLRGEIPVYEAEYRIRTKNGDWKYFYDRGRVVKRDKDNKPLEIAGVVFDITNSKKNEEELRNANQMKNKMFSILAHDLRGPMGSIAATLDIMVNEKDGFDDEEVNVLMREMNVSAKAVFNLLENLLIWARKQQGTLEVKKEGISINSIVTKNLKLLNSNIKHKKIAVEDNLKKSYVFFADENMINLVFRNILNNAIKFTNTNGKIVIDAQENEDSLTIYIKDNGMGIPEETIKDILAGKNQKSTRGTKGETGTGLGLSLCMQFLEMNDAKLDIESKEDLGSVFKIIFDLKAIKNQVD